MPAKSAILDLMEGAVPDESIWHARPLGMHSLSKPNGVGKGADFIGVDYFTYFCGILNLVTLEVSGKAGAKAINPADFALEDWRWFPTHLFGRWRASSVEVDMRVMLTSPDDATLWFTVRNRGKQPFDGEVAVLGDENLDTMGDWGKYALSGAFDLMNQGALTRKTISIGEYSDCFPWVTPVQEKMPLYWKFYHHYTQAAFALHGGAWRMSEAPCVSRPGRKRVVVDEKTGQFRDDALCGRAQRRWKGSRPLSLAPGAETEFVVRASFAWTGRKPLSAAAGRKLYARAAAPFEAWDKALARQRRFWIDQLKRVPRPSPALPPRFARLYYKAWVATFQNLMPPFYGGIRDYRQPVFSTNKVAPGFQAPCMWESVIGSFLMGYVSPALAARTLDAIVSCIEEDGVLLEDCGYSRATTLPSILGVVALNLSRQGMDPKWLRKWRKPLMLNWRQQYRYPTWKRFGQPLCRNYFYAYHNGQALLEISRILRRPAKEIQAIADRLRDIRTMVQAYWNEDKGWFRAQINTQVGNCGHFEPVEGTNGELMVGMRGDVLPEKQRRAMARMIRQQMLYGRYMVANVPSKAPGLDTGTPGKNAQPTFAIKPANYLYLWPGLRDTDPKLFAKAVDRTLAGVANANEFSENYNLDGQCRHNQPMSFFGMFAVIWSVLLDKRYAPKGLRGVEHGR